MSAQAIVQRQLDAYNAQDLDAFCVCFTPDCVFASLNGAVLAEGLNAIRARHAKIFADFPQNRATLVHRIELSGAVIDHEDVERAPGGERFQLAAIYALRDGLIARVDYVR